MGSRTEDLLTQHRRVHDRAQMAVWLHAGPDASRSFHDFIRDRVRVDVLGEDDAKEFCEPVGALVLEAVGKFFIFKQDASDSVCVYGFDGVEDGFRYLMFVRGARESDSYVFPEGV
jgi:hypothetical protein